MKTNDKKTKLSARGRRHVALWALGLLLCSLLLLSSCELSGGIGSLFHWGTSSYQWDGQVRISVADAEGIRVTSPNPLTVPFGGTAEFTAELEEGYAVDHVSGFAKYEDGRIVLKEALFPTTLKLRTRKLDRVSFSLNGATGGWGTVECSLTDGEYWEDTVAHLSAQTDPHFKFVGYTLDKYLSDGGKLLSEDPVFDFKITENSAVCANFERVSSEIRLSAVPGLTVTTENPVTVPVGGTCTFGYKLDTGYDLDIVSGGATFDGKNITLTDVRSPASLTPTVKELSKFSFDALSNDTAGGTVTSSVMNGKYWERTDISVYAHPGEDYEFLGFSLNSPSAESKYIVTTAPQYSFRLTKDTVIYAHFKIKGATVTLDLTEASGVFPKEGDSVLIPLGSTAEFPLTLGDRVVIDSVSGNAVYADGVIRLENVREDTVIKVTAHRPALYKFNVLLNNTRGGKITSNLTAGSYAPGTPISVDVTQVANGYMFSGYSVNAPLDAGGKRVSDGSDYVATLEGDTVLYANFVAAKDPALTVTVPSGKWAVIYHPNGGLNTKSQNHVSYRTEYFSNTYYWCPNAMPDKGEFTRTGYVLLGYNTKQDGTGDYYAPGWNIIMPEGRKAITLYCVWARESNPADFTFQSGRISKYTGTDEMVVIPETINGEKVKTLGTGMIANNQNVKSLMISKNVSTVENRAVTDCKNLTTLYCTNNVTSFSDTWYAGCPKYTSFIAMAARNPGYMITSSWNATYGVAWELMMTVKTPKMVVISGSNTAYGINSRIIKQRLAEAGYNYEVINYGQNASTPAMMYIEFCSHFLNKGDLMLLNPEVNSYQYGNNTINTTTWQILDGTYDALYYLDISKYSKVYTSFADHNSASIKNAGKNYTYENYDKRINRYGDHEWDKNGTIDSQAKSFDGMEASGGTLSFNSGVSYIKNATYQAAYNRVLDLVAARGATVMSSFASVVSCNLTAASLEPGGKEQTAYENAVDTYIHTNRISKVNDYIYDRKYFYNSVYHLNNDGQTMRTELVCKDIIAFLNTKK